MRKSLLWFLLAVVPIAYGQVVNPSVGVNILNSTVDNSVIGGVTPAAAHVTTLSASGAVTGAGFTALFASPPAIGGTAPAAGAFTVLSGQTVAANDPGGFGSAMTFGTTACETAYAPTVAHNGTVTITTGLNCLPANSVIDAVVYRITTTLSGNAISSFTVGITGTTALFCGAQSTLTSGTTGICYAQTGSAASINTTAAPVIVTENQIATAGAIRLIVYYHTWTAPAS